jgi:UDP-N-acetylglucosamine acyltransferase
MPQHIHPTAFIAPDVTLGDNITIGPFAVIESNVELGDGCQVGAHAVVQSYVKMGTGNILHPHAVLGGLPQDTSFKAETVSWLVCGDNNVFREGFTAHRSAKENGETRIGSGCFLMNNSHIAHDCVIGDGTIFANNVVIGGHVEIDDKVFLGGGVAVHQFCRIGSYVMVQGLTGIGMDLIPFTLVAGRPARHYKLNTVGLRRAGITGERYNVLSSAFRLLKNKKAINDLEETDEIRYLKEWLSVKSKRGLHGFFDGSDTKE